MRIYKYPKLGTTRPRHTARGIVIKSSHVLLMERHNDGLHYFSIPGGGIEKNETAKIAAKREILEETSVKVTVERKLYEMHDPDGHVHTIFLCGYVSGEPILSKDSEEAIQMLATKGKQQYKPTWVKFEDIAKLPFRYWQPVGDRLLHDIKNGWPKKPIILNSVK